MTFTITEIIELNIIISPNVVRLVTIKKMINKYAL